MSTLEGRCPLNRKNLISEMHRYHRGNYDSLPFRPTIRQLLFWAISSGTHVPEKFSLPGTGRGYNRVMIETEMKMVMYPKEVTMEDIDLLFFNTGWKTRYMDDHEPMQASEGILGGGSRPDPMKHFRNLSAKEALDLSNGVKSGRLADAYREYGSDEEYDGQGSNSAAASGRGRPAAAANSSYNNNSSFHAAHAAAAEESRSVRDAVLRARAAPEDLQTDFATSAYQASLLGQEADNHDDTDPTGLERLQEFEMRNAAERAHSEIAAPAETIIAEPAEVRLCYICYS